MGGALESPRDLGCEILSGLNILMTLWEMFNSAEREPEETTSIDRQGIQKKDQVTNPLSKFLTQNCFCLREMQEQKWNRN